jgi:hypothetical protein
MVGVKSCSMNAFEEVSRPVIFEHEGTEYSYWGKGSSFLISTSRQCYWVTAAHVLKNLGGSVQSLRVFPSDQSRVSLPFNQQCTIRTGPRDDEDHKDVFVLRIDLSEFDSSGDSPLVTQDIDQGTLAAEDLRPDDVLWVIGYPAESNFIDYDSHKIKTTRSVIRGVYAGFSISEHCHKLTIASSIKLESYDGLSGSPVFFLKSIPKNGMTLLYPLLVGMLLWGTASSSTMHFVSSRVITSLINAAEKRPNMPLVPTAHPLARVGARASGAAAAQRRR